jgi:hypothetical protein
MHLPLPTESVTTVHINTRITNMLELITIIQTQAMLEDCVSVFHRVDSKVFQIHPV